MATKREELEDYKPWKTKDTYSADENTLMSIYTAYRREAEEARLSRIQQNKVNYDAYHSRQDYSYKEKGQSQEFLPKMFIAVEQGANSIQQGLVDMGEWFRVYPAPGMVEEQLKIRPGEVLQILKRQLEHARYMTKVGDSVKLGFLGALMIAKVHGHYKPKQTYTVERELGKDGSYKKKLLKSEDKVWQLAIDLVRQQDWRPDPTGSHVYRMQDVYLDYHKLKAMAEKKGSGYNMDRVQDLKASSGLSSALQEYEKSRETGQNMHNANFRHRIKLTEVWGDFVSSDGELVWEHCVAAIANDNIVVKPPMPIKLWHGSHPYVDCPILTVPHSVWGKTPFDSAAVLNIAQNELFNLILDGGMAAVHGIKQIREHWLTDPSQVEDGVPPGTSLKVNTNCPPGAVALERVDTTTIPAEVLPVYNLLNQEFGAAAMADAFQPGLMPQRQVKATEIVETSKTHSAMFTAMAKHLEVDYVKPTLEKAWLTIAQHLHEMDEDELKVLLGEKRASEILAMGPEEIFAETATSLKFEVFGISETLAKQKDFTKLQAMLQTVAASPILMEEFTKKYDFGKLLTEIVKSLDIPIYKIEHDEDQSKPEEPAGVAPQVPNQQSQIPQAGAAVNQPGTSPQAHAQPGAPGGAPNFPPSIALRAGGQ